MKTTGFLIIHGFGGSTYEVEPLGEYLSSKGFKVLCPKLKGHTGKREDMRKVRYEDWIQSAEEELKILQKECDEIILIGFSMGGFIALNLSLKYDTKAIVTINTPIFYWDVKRIFLNIANDIKSKDFHSLKRYVKATGGVPISAAINFRLLLGRAKRILKDIKCPILVIQSKDDDASQLRSSNYIFDNVGSTKKILKQFENGGHLILRSKWTKDAIDEIESFIHEL